MLTGQLCVVRLTFYPSRALKHRDHVCLYRRRVMLAFYIGSIGRLFGRSASVAMAFFTILLSLCGLSTLYLVGAIIVRKFSDSRFKSLHGCLDPPALPSTLPLEPLVACWRTVCPTSSTGTVLP